MNVFELKKRLNNEKIPVTSYSIENCGIKNEVFCLEKNNKLWEVYYSERGQKSNLKKFINEEIACDYFYKWLIESLKRIEKVN